MHSALALFSFNVDLATVGVIIDRVVHGVVVIVVVVVVVVVSIDGFSFVVSTVDILVFPIVRFSNEGSTLDVKFLCKSHLS